MKFDVAGNECGGEYECKHEVKEADNMQQLAEQHVKVVLMARAGARRVLLTSGLLCRRMVKQLGYLRL